MRTEILAIFTFASVVASIPTQLREPAMYSEEWWNEKMLQWLSHPNKPTAASNLAEAAALASFVCPAPKFTCTPYTASGSPSDVRHVRPSDITTVMAIGDSITAGFGMNSGKLPFTSITEYRGLAFSIGGDSGATTVPNFLKVYNSKVAGEALGTTALHATIDVLDAAVSGAVVADLVGQVATLSNAFQAGSYSKTGWNMINLLIGANDACAICNDASHAPAAFENNFRATINALKSNFTNSIVNVVSLFNVSQVYAVQQTSSYCGFAQGILNECKCDSTAANRALMDSTTASYDASILKVAAEFSGLPNFSVNVQTGVRNMVLNSLNYLAGIDCFHPNQCAHQTLAAAMWNNMFQPAGQKTDYQLGSVTSIYCPGPNDYFQ